MTGSKEENGSNNSNDISHSNSSTKKLPKNWAIILVYTYIHVLGIIGLYLLFTKVKWMTLLYFLFHVTISYVTIGAVHRYYAHQAFIVISELRFFLVLAHTIAGVGSIYKWVFWHRIHHYYHNSDRDPYDHRKGFFYSHVLSNLQYAPPDLKLYSKNIDMRDVDSDRFVWVQQKFYHILFFVLGLLLPMYVPVTYWDESFWYTFFVIGATRLMITTHISWLVNSALSVWGLQKEDRYPVNDNSVFFLSKSYWANYHYIIPYDWKSNEFGLYENGFTTFIFKIWYEMGLIDGMKTVNTEDVRETLEKIAISKVSIKNAFDELKEKSEINACKQRLIYRP
ncbi:acyl-CoA Delta(11) desaturase-like [Odontomachus brunneus]|uniref:acyl-CoA Delta(11) desaturase-like n=1 Tax=Odontomachus brunneus TaxID=486640 RepID=UPI0013F20DF1|nr:acyl-CoA Delta(11) desaturase-like [Odontomachus brunneus]